MANTIQPGEYSTGSGDDECMHVTDSDGNPNVFNVKRNDDGQRWLNANYANPTNRWNLSNEIVFRLRNWLHILPPLLWAGVLFCKLATPTTEHFPDYRVLRTTTKRRMVKRIQEHPTLETIASYAGMLQHGNTRKLQKEFLEPTSPEL
ncbi:MAG: hypothetical protein A2945_02560 [Candidatus Liptonbacteria bacterium RIFCSPLOWO2_01_FULL_52_25]|uniref:Uncharacterized protein n=1 Tax=Candidatus Liptonbacteria bacterium RIFCSPLOWO2_01_FULL_52_25 TaxID=1798650 RepID=A0A1G2CEM7_9BACT|nr:MAG: hypothetical protein A2945_02560 [Candidatus Liptonbacteria bacterium RIFCSPLOWO2_01_FULL_52_25]